MQDNANPATDKPDEAGSLQKSMNLTVTQDMICMHTDLQKDHHNHQLSATRNTVTGAPLAFPYMPIDGVEKNRAALDCLSTPFHKAEVFLCHTCEYRSLSESVKCPNCSFTDGNHRMCQAPINIHSHINWLPLPCNWEYRPIRAQRPRCTMGSKTIAITTPKANAAHVHPFQVDKSPDPTLPSVHLEWQ